MADATRKIFAPTPSPETEAFWAAAASATTTRPTAGA